MKNVEIRIACMKAGIKQWRLAEACGLSEAHFSKKLRKELPDKEQEKILKIIAELAQERQEAE